MHQKLAASDVMYQASANARELSGMRNSALDCIFCSQLFYVMRQHGSQSRTSPTLKICFEARSRIGQELYLSVLTLEFWVGINNLAHRFRVLWRV